MSVTQINHDIQWDSFISALDKDDLLLFVHGFNTNFTNAAIRAAQLGHDTNFDGEVILYSWPSKQSPATYPKDKDRAEENFELLSGFLADVAEKTDKEIHIVAHSMGTYLLMNALQLLEDRIKSDENLLSARRKHHDGNVFGQIILAAPDIAEDDYRKTFGSMNLDNLAHRITLYSAENDHVLDVSRIINHFVEGTSQPRIGDTSKSFVVIPGIDTVDARQEISPQFFGHSFYANYRSLVTDIHLLLRYGTSPDKRMLQKVKDRELNTIWFIRD